MQSHDEKCRDDKSFTPINFIVQSIFQKTEGFAKMKSAEEFETKKEASNRFQIRTNQFDPGKT